MEIDRVQQVIRGIKVQRTGSEQDRRRRRDTDEEFRELLDASISDDEDEEQPIPADTVSIASKEALAPLVNDLVSISSTARVGAEVSNARQSTARNIAEETVAQEMLDKAEAVQETPEAQADQKQNDSPDDKLVAAKNDPSVNGDEPVLGIDTVA
jgi:hypothetical protein